MCLSYSVLLLARLRLLGALRQAAAVSIDRGRCAKVAVGRLHAPRRACCRSQHLFVCRLRRLDKNNSHNNSLRRLNVVYSPHLPSYSDQNNRLKASPIFIYNLLTSFDQQPAPLLQTPWFSSRAYPSRGLYLWTGTGPRAG